MSATSRSRRRGMVMVMVLIFVALLLIVALAIIAGSNTAIESATAVSIKYRVLNAAEGAANVALNDVASNPAEASGTDIKGSLNGVAYDAWIRENNILSGTATTYTDPVTGNSIPVPPYSAYVYGVAADLGGRTTTVEAIAQPTQPLTLPPGTVNAAIDVYYDEPMMISSDPTDKNNADDASLNANGDILASGTPGTVQGFTGAVGLDQVNGVLGKLQISPMTFPSMPQVSEAARTAQLAAGTGSQILGTQVAGGQTYTGNVYVNGDVTLSSGTVTFSGGTYIYVNGNLTLTGTGQIVNGNTGTNEFVVSGNVVIKPGIGGTAAYSAVPKANSLLLVLGTVDLETETASSVGTIFAPNGDITLAGAGSLVGAIDTGGNMHIEGTNNSTGMQYDTAQQSTTLNTGALTFSSYIEY